MDTHNLCADYVTSTGVSGELDIVIIFSRCNEGQRSEEEERGDWPHGRRGSRTDNANGAAWIVGYILVGVGQPLGGAVKWTAAISAAYPLRSLAVHPSCVVYASHLQTILGLSVAATQSILGFCDLPPLCLSTLPLISPGS